MKHVLENGDVFEGKLKDGFPSGTAEITYKMALNIKEKLKKDIL